MKAMQNPEPRTILPPFQVIYRAKNIGVVHKGLPRLE